eukprot:1189401-Prorocentrum_minimum.AAC.5
MFGAAKPIRSSSPKRVLARKYPGGESNSPVVEWLDKGLTSASRPTGDAHRPADRSDGGRVGSGHLLHAARADGGLGRAPLGHRLRPASGAEAHAEGEAAAHGCAPVRLVALLRAHRLRSHHLRARHLKSHRSSINVGRTCPV